MSLFQKTVITKYLKTQNPETISQKWEVFREHFHNPTIQENIRNSKEEQYQGEFLIDLFVNVLGYTKNPTPNFNLTTEYKNVKDSKKADGAIIIGDNVVGIIELKGTNTTDLSKIEDQAFGYKNNQLNCKYVITSNFEKLRLYIDNAIEHIEFNLFELDQEQFNLLYLCLAYENIQQNIPGKIKDESLSQEDAITKKLYKDYSVFKRELFQNLTAQNPQYDALELFQKSQKLLDRLLFLFFGEDRGLLPPNSVRLILQQWEKLRDLDEYVPLYHRFKKYFGYLNTGFKGKHHDVFAYNGGLFKPDEILDSITIDDDLLFKHASKLSEYDFASEVDVNILGHIFENSLNEIDEIKAQLEGQEIDKTKTKRKKDGVFYTPKYITKYIVENTVGKLCEEKKLDIGIIEEEYFTDKKRQLKTKENLLGRLNTYRDWLHQLTIVDPACGSGAFLNEALNFLITEHNYVDELETKLTGSSFTFTYHSESILENNLFGVDLNEESVEIAKLSLWLRTAEPNRKLNSLNDNIKCGNSLIDDPEIAGEKAFKWEKEFPQVFAKGGFDVVIGNPPYVQQQLQPGVKKFLTANFSTIEGKPDLYRIFIEKSINLLNDAGYLSFITPSSFLTIPSSQKLRAFIKSKTAIIQILTFKGMVFETAGVNTAIFILSKNFNQRKNVEFITDLSKNPSPETLAKALNTNSYEVQDNLEKFEILEESEYFGIIKKIKNNSTPLYQIAEYTIGLQVYHNSIHTQEQIKNRIYHSLEKKNQTYIPEVGGSMIGRYRLAPTKEYVSYGEWNYNKPAKNFISTNTIMVREIPSKANLLCTLSKDISVGNKAVILVKTDEDFKLELLAILNSRLMGFYINNTSEKSKQNLFPRISLTSIKNVPIKKSGNTRISEKASLMLLLNEQLDNIIYKFLQSISRRFNDVIKSKKLLEWYKLSYPEYIRELAKQKIKLTLSEEAEWADYFDQEKSKALEIQSKIASTDKEIDQMVYELYGLSEEEIELIEKQ
ncbi:Eco57I restriction-modification methylase domain-containing protein [Chryseobacterium sp. MFBS3-17]|uniref:Eco57I restriction-modification methylase domain-containing protein n=1 Tax=Chryseobacterium sp. MFBS3-17 TaxID=2886689 RepID=UPI001D0E2DF6|nr:N-6 DNA methylase [Chryseobacterium sp. MFBS3-17]MCC2591183.1 N-6 DNA methylase [Chryseobacterium sp. MFBS3-17]